MKKPVTIEDVILIALVIVLAIGILLITEPLIRNAFH